MMSATTIAELGAKMHCGKCGEKDVFCKGGTAGGYAGICEELLSV